MKHSLKSEGSPVLSNEMKQVGSCTSSVAIRHVLSITIFRQIQILMQQPLHFYAKMHEEKFITFLQMKFYNTEIMGLHFIQDVINISVQNHYLSRINASQNIMERCKILLTIQKMVVVFSLEIPDPYLNHSDIPTPIAL